MNQGKYVFSQIVVLAETLLQHSAVRKWTEYLNSPTHILAHLQGTQKPILRSQPCKCAKIFLCTV